MELEAARPISLNGEWRFAWGRLNSGALPETEPLFSVPGFWNGRKAGLHQLSAQGYATYSVRVLATESRLMAVRLVDMESAFALFANGKLIASNGIVGRSPTQERPEWKPMVALLPLAPETELVLQVSNFHHRLGGVWQGLALGPPQLMFSAQRSAVALELFMAGSLLMIAVYHVLVFLARRAGLPFLLLGLFCAAMALRTVVTGERFILEMIPALSWESLVRLDYLTVSVGVCISHWHLCTVFRGHYHRPVLYLLFFIFGTCALAELFLLPVVFTHLMPVHIFVVAIWSLYFLIVCFVAMLRGMPGAGVIWVGWLVAIGAALHDALYIESLIDSRYLSAVGLQAFVLTQSYYLARQYSAAFSFSELLAARMRRLLTLTRELNRAGERTSAIRTAMEEISRATATSPGAWKAYAPLRDPHLLEKFGADGVSEELSADGSAELLRLQAPVASDEWLRIPLRSSDQCLCILELQVSEVDRQNPPDIIEDEYLTGVLDSLRLVLDNMFRVQKEELARIGLTAAEVVHDINHHCYSIAALTKALDQSSPGLHRDPQLLVKIDLEVAAIRNLALDVMDFAREGLIVVPRLNDSPIVAALIRDELEQTFGGSQVEYVVTECSTGKVWIDLDRFRRIVSNLSRNALEAMGKSGRFMVAVEHQSGSCCFTFEDTGPGLPTGLAERLFEPFASGGSGAGLGLAVVRRIALAHGGDVRVGSRPGGGTRFLIELPATDPGQTMGPSSESAREVVA